MLIYAIAGYLAVSYAVGMYLLLQARGEQHQPDSHR
jgi:hypothetical protein